MNTSSSKELANQKWKNLQISQTKMKPSFVNWMKMESGKNVEQMKKKLVWNEQRKMEKKMENIQTFQTFPIHLKTIPNISNILKHFWSTVVPSKMEMENRIMEGNAMQIRQSVSINGRDRIMKCNADQPISACQSVVKSNHELVVSRNWLLTHLTSAFKCWFVLSEYPNLLDVENGECCHSGKSIKNNSNLLDG